MSNPLLDKKMVVVHFVTIPCHANLVQPIFSTISICVFANGVVHGSFGDFKNFLYDFVSVFKISYAKSYG